MKQQHGVSTDGIATARFADQDEPAGIDASPAWSAGGAGHAPSGPAAAVATGALSAAAAWASWTLDSQATQTTQTVQTRVVRDQRPAPGGQVGRYIVIERLGQGGMGVVYKAWDPELARQVALKLVRVGHLRCPARARARLVREAQALAQLSHPNVIAVHDVGTWDEHVFIAMEFVDGQTLGRWMATARAIDEILEVFLAAGRGLAAAHAAGLVHRDFKPDNVIMGHDGRVRVLDFGLARPAAPIDHESGAEAGERGLLDVSLTISGAIVGTPGYIAPEQYRGGATDTRGDQFAFCVALHEALYGTLPFPGKGLEELGQRTLRGEIAPPPADRKVPAWLHAIVVRGLAVHPEARHASMAALLEALQRGRGQRRQRLRLAVGTSAALVIATLAGGAIALAEHEADLCQGGAARLAQVWNPEAAAALRASFLASGRPHAEGAAGRVAGELDAYGQAWVRMHADACEATHVRGEQSEAMLDLRMSCLSHHLGAVRALTHVLASSADPGMSAAAVDRALGAARQLPDLAVCADEDALREAFPLPADPALRQEIAALSEDLDDAEVRGQIGQFRAVSAELTALATRADALDFPPLQARAHFQRGQVQSELGQLDLAEASLRQAAQHAARARDDRLLAAIWTALMWLVGDGYGRAEEALRLRPVAEAAIARAGGDHGREADLLAHVGALLSRTGQHAAAEPLLARAIEIGREERGADHPAVTRYQTFLGAVYFAQADYGRALALLQQLIAITEAACGHDHLFLVEPMRQIGHVLLAQGEYERALGYFEQGAEVERASLGEDAPGMAQHLLDIATAALASGNDARADEALAQAWSLVARAGQPDHPLAAHALLGRGRLHLARGDLSLAERDLADALAMIERVHGPRHERYADALWHLAVVDLGRARGEAALARFTQVLDIRAAALPAKHPAVAQALRGVGAAHLLLGDLERAREPLQRALAILEQALGPDSPQVLGALEDLGALAFALGRHAEARDVFERALAIRERRAGASEPPALHALLGRGLAGLALGDTVHALALLDRAWTLARAPGAGRPGLDRALTPLGRSRAALVPAVCHATQRARTARTLLRDVRALLAAHHDDAGLRALAAGMRSSCPGR